ncbi:hypothetical protein ZYGM_002663 [Zygosaccharomyces mellis]|uniref:Uncharacterized protein n=1 Tax=Zygosaccharomyces mellis TaxID=42258 RepID=A0A4C2EDZ2_9SACH|nr:hypothetical protein ZYGM_002663 [Zygosaccharomyces mellis]
MFANFFKSPQVALTEPVSARSFNEKSSASDKTNLPECPIKNRSSSQLPRPDSCDEEGKPQLLTRIHNKLNSCINSRNFKVLMVLAAVLNILQLMAFFLIGILYLPKRTKKSLKNEDIYFIMDHVADNYIDYDFFANESVL